jgi:hypothetical protein
MTVLTVMLELIQSVSVELCYPHFTLHLAVALNGAGLNKNEMYD